MSDPRSKRADPPEPCEGCGCDFINEDGETYSHYFDPEDGELKCSICGDPCSPPPVAQLRSELAEKQRIIEDVKSCFQEVEPAFSMLRRIAPILARTKEQK